jgi:hypothetical protein
VPTLGMSRSMTNFCKAIAVLLYQTFTSSRHQEVPLAILDQP